MTLAPSRHRGFLRPSIRQRAPFGIRVRTTSTWTSLEAFGEFLMSGFRRSRSNRGRVDVETEIFRTMRLLVHGSLISRETRRHKPDNWQGRFSRPRFIWLFDVYPRPTRSTIPLRGSRTYAHARPRSPQRTLGVERGDSRARTRCVRGLLVHLLRRAPQVSARFASHLPCALRRLRAEED